jgi:5'(3')-deoxyribonucleotidase
MTRIINLDCDGTFINLYGVDGWLNDIINEDVRPYREAKPLVNLVWFARTIHELQDKGWKVNIISWTAKNGSKEYNKRVTETKIEWLEKHLPSVTFDNIHIVEYGTPKTSLEKGILFDDEEHNRNEWNGIAFNEVDLIKKMRTFI